MPWLREALPAGRSDPGAVGTGPCRVNTAQINLSGHSSPISAAGIITHLRTAGFRELIRGSRVARTAGVGRMMPAPGTADGAWSRAGDTQCLPGPKRIWPFGDTSI